ncbi:osmoprotectant transport system permease protein [Antricoccus suffuscus]|uniref:Osmoprotectant transport system permease protein n=1 Tax=Antricoccus suffuscus TaxID=1629062 RepID=A0A2T0ZY49_9ACTN|nr:ABC transporter permease [Antricoccus suffuscus]PRZ41214.1 osmoprotectant transport system permease protein [Antricoccus suffuscus]
MSIFQLTWNFLSAGSNWTGAGGIPTRILEHLGYTFLSLLVAMIVAVPVGMYIGHTGRFAFLAINIGNASRALPTIGLLTLVVLLISRSLWPVVLVLALLAIPPILTSTYAGIQNVDKLVVDAAIGVGMTPREALFKTKLPMALPVMFGGLRSGVLQLVSTATVAAYVGLGGLGRYILDGAPQQDFGKMAGGALLVALLAIVLDLLIAGIARLTISRGLRRTASVRGKPGDAISDDASEVTNVDRSSAR